jgi:TolB-like protein
MPQESPQDSAAAGAASTSAELSGLQAPRHISKWLPYKLFVGLSAIGLLAASAFLLRKPDEGTKKPTPAGRVTTLAVLPFRSLGADSNDRDIGLSIAEAVITKLANSTQLSIEPLSTVLHYADANQDSLAMGRAMHVDYVLEGKFQKAGGRLRVSVQLLCIACDANAHWAANFDEALNDVSQVQDSISEKVAAALPGTNRR